jgi:hypothetical protein
MSTLGKLSDVRGKPTAEELEKIRNDALQIAKSL